jgi:hypothetical protein
MYDTLVEAIRAKHPGMTYAAAILQAAKEQPDLARARNIELSLPVGPGGVVMTGI